MILWSTIKSLYDQVLIENKKNETNCFSYGFSRWSENAKENGLSGNKNSFSHCSRLRR